MVTQCDWSWYLDVGSSLITCYNKSTWTAEYQYDSAHCIQQRRHITHTDWLCIVGEIITKTKISVVTRVYLVKSGQHRETGSTQQRNLVKSGQHKNEISWNRVNIVKSGQHKNEVSWNRIKTKTKSREIWSMWDVTFIMKYVNAYLYWSGSLAAATATVVCSRCRLPRHSSHIQTAAAIAAAVWCSAHRPYKSAIYG